jgi:hypothetical protein
LRDGAITSLMWELFDNQPSLGWAESELWDAMAQLDAAYHERHLLVRLWFKIEVNRGCN